MKENVHIGTLVREIFEKSNMTVVEFADKINYSRANVYNIFNRPTIDLKLLQTISKILKYDFLAGLCLEKEIVITILIKVKSKIELDNLKNNPDIVILYSDEELP